MANVTVRAVYDGDKSTAQVIGQYTVDDGVNLYEVMQANIPPEKAGYVLDYWYNWDWYGHKCAQTLTTSGWMNLYVTYTARAEETGGVYLRSDGVWKQYAAAYRKENGAWVRQEKPADAFTSGNYQVSEDEHE